MSLRSRRIDPFSFSPRLPGDKSITHRAYLLGALAAGETVVHGGNDGSDCRATLAAVRSLGVKTEVREDMVLLQGSSGSFTRPAETLDLGNSGTGLRLLLGLLAAQPFSITLSGDESLRRRPVERVLAPLRAMGARAEAPGDHPPVTLTGGELRGIDVTLPVASAQVKSALLLAGVQAAGDTRVRGGAGSRDHTERMLPLFGVSVDTAPEEVSVTGKQALTAADFRVPGDFSAAVFYLQAAAMVPGSRVTFSSVGLNPTRTGALECFREMGLDLEIAADTGTGEPRGRLSARSSKSRGITVNPERVSGLIDELPALAVAAALAEGESVFRGAGELRYKESNRLETVARGLEAIGASVELREDGWTIRGSAGRPLPGGRVESRGDHRIAMAFLMAGLASETGVEIVDASGIETSDPIFTTNLKKMEHAG